MYKKINLLNSDSIGKSVQCQKLQVLEGPKCSKCLFSPVRCVFSFRIFGDLKNYTFLETLGSTESEKQCLHFFPSTLWPPSWIFKMATIFFLKSGNISASNHPRHMILASKLTFSRSMNPVGQRRM